MSRTGWLIFLGVQVAGEVCSWTARHFLSVLGPVLWVVGSVLLLPGDMGAAFLLDKLLWNSRLTAPQMTMLQVPVGLAINAAVWLLCAKLYRTLRERQSDAPSTSNSSDPNFSHPSR